MNLIFAILVAIFEYIEIQTINSYNVNQSSSVASEISADITAVNASASEMSSNSAQVNESSTELSNLAEQFKALVSQFKV